MKVDTPDVVCSSNMRTFWVNFREGHVRVGHKGSEEPFMDWADPNPFKVRLFNYIL